MGFCDKKVCVNQCFLYNFTMEEWGRAQSTSGVKPIPALSGMWGLTVLWMVVV